MKLRILACREYLRNGFLYTSEQIIRCGFPKDGTLKMRFYRALLRIKIIRNTDSFKFVVKRFRNLNTGKYWWLINLVFWTILTNNQGEQYESSNKK